MTWIGKTIYVCSKCGETTEQWSSDEDWLIASAPGSQTGEMVIRCPEHISEYAVRKAGGHIEEGRGVVNNWEFEIA